jgi:hypothetical protein
MQNFRKLKFSLISGIIGFSIVFVVLPILGHAWRKKQPSFFPSVVPANQWKRFESQEGGFRVLFPGTPEITTNIFNTKTGEIPMLCFSTWADRQTQYAVNYSDSPKIVEKLNAQQQFDASQKGVTDKFGEIIVRRDFKFGDCPARDFEFVAGGKANFSGRVRLILDNQRLYQIMVIFLTKKPHQDDFKTFFDSFSISKEEKK